MPTKLMRELGALIIFLLSVYGVANAVVVLKTRLVFHAVLGRVWIVKDMILCPPCVGFWTGIVFGRWILSPASFYGCAGIPGLLLDGFSALGAVWLLHLKAERLAASPSTALDL